MRRFHALLPLLALTLAATACRGPALEVPAWSYSGDAGPERWGELRPEYALAATGRAQSPIDIVTAEAVAGDAPALAVDYAPTELEVLNNGHTVEVDYHGDGHLSVGDHVYTLDQFHFHSPSEHTVDGGHAAIELHLVHRDSAGELAVVGVLIEEGAEHAAFARLTEHLPREPAAAHVVAGASVDADDFLPPSLAAWRYPGSLTTPPCSEGVAWFVLREPIEVSAAQIEAFRRIYDGNRRPTQPRNGRVVAATD